MKILVTGSEGNIGKVLVPYLESQGHTVFGIDIVQKVDEHYQVVDINSPLDMLTIFRQFKPEVVYHMAAMVSRVTCEKSQAITMQTNLVGTNNVIQLCLQYQTKLIFFSTSEVYGNIEGELDEDRTDLKPNNFYGLSKLMGESLVHYAVSMGLHAIIVRPFMFYHENETLGAHRSAMIRFVECLLRQEKIVVHKNSSRSWMHLEDGVDVLERLLYVTQNCTINIGSPNNISVSLLASYICKQLDLDYSSYVEEVDLPERMTLHKDPVLVRQIQLTRYTACKVPIEEGIERVITSVKSRL